MALLTLTLLALLATLAVAIAHAAVHGLQTFAQALHAIESLLTARSLALLTADGGLGLADLIAQAIEAFGDSRLDGAGEGTGALADPIGAALQQALQIGILDAREGFAQLGGSVPLRGGQRAHGLAHLVLQAREVVRGFLAILRELALLLPRRRLACAGAGRSPVRPGLAEHVGHAVGLLALFGGQAIRFASQRIELAGGLFLLLATQQIGGFAQALGGTTGVGFTLPLRGRAAHVVAGLANAVQGLLDA